MNIRILLLTLSLTAAISLGTGIAANGQEVDKTQAPKITNAKLNSINMGLDSIEYWIEKMKQGDARRGDSLTMDMEKLQTRFGRIPVSTDEQYTYVAGRFDTLRNSIKSKKSTTATTSKPVNNSAKVDQKQALAYLNEMRTKYFETLKLPEARKMFRTRELTGEDVQYFVGAMQAFGADVETDLAKIKEASAQTGGTNTDLIRWIETGSVEVLQTEMKRVKQQMDKLIGNAMRDAKNVSELDIEKNKYAFSTASVRKNHMDKFERAMRTMEQAKVFEEALGLPATWSNQSEELKKYVDTYVAKAEQAGIVKELPADIGDAELAKIARECLAKKDYGVGQIEKLVVNARKVPRDRTDTRFFNNRLETTVRQWEEFQVCTVEVEDGEHFVYFNTLRNFSRGDVTTPINEWILAHRWKSGKIAADKVK